MSLVIALTNDEDVVLVNKNDVQVGSGGFAIPKKEMFVATFVSSELPRIVKAFTIQGKTEKDALTLMHSIQVQKQVHGKVQKHLSTEKAFRKALPNVKGSLRDMNAIVNTTGEWVQAGDGLQKLLREVITVGKVSKVQAERATLEVPACLWKEWGIAGMAEGVDYSLMQMAILILSVAAGVVYSAILAVASMTEGEAADYATRQAGRLATTPISNKNMQAMLDIHGVTVVVKALQASMDPPQISEVLYKLPPKALEVIKDLDENAAFEGRLTLRQRALEAERLVKSTDKAELKAAPETLAQVERTLRVVLEKAFPLKGKVGAAGAAVHAVEAQQRPEVRIAVLEAQIAEMKLQPVAQRQTLVLSQHRAATPAVAPALRCHKCGAADHTKASCPQYKCKGCRGMGPGHTWPSCPNPVHGVYVARQ